MSVLWHELGFIRWPLAFSVLAVGALTLWSALRLFRPSAVADLRTKAWLDAILFWGGFALISGVLGTLVGIIIASQAIEAAGAVSTSLVWGGIKIALVSSAMGALTLAMAALCWFVLQLRWRLLVAGEAEALAG
ncbi:MAG: MotA/TolQ/ExbB proton channel family protein [Gemmatimonadota bacterium]|nr:MotA/TolQ/ExbB proton channel family protein [Gemmatimonadota bacterium]MDH5759821.1 MotA/TolQ/ExbB proton channel family protein [Gemmatimonadota bacterium]